MRNLKRVLSLVLITSLFSFFSCTKEGEKGDSGINGANGINGVDSPTPKTFNFSLTFNSGDTFQSYSGITGVDSDDVMLFYILYETLGTTDYWSGIPLELGNVSFIPEFSDQSGLVFINTLKADGTAGSPFASTFTYGFKVVVIKSSQRLANPNIDYTNYYEVKGAFSLED